MKRFSKAVVFTVAALALLPPAAQGQQVIFPDDSVAPPPLEIGEPAMAANFTEEHLDQMLAPVALYPDTLVAQILMASTYPLEVVEASRWLQQPGHAQLQGEALAAAVEPQAWDPSIKALTPFPQILAMMDKNLEWTEQLGDAFLAQPAAVTDSIQRLRRMAQSSGHLSSTPQQVVVQEQNAILIMPADPQVVYVPVYDPGVAYGAWPYVASPPYYFAPPASYAYAGPGIIGFGAPVTVVTTLWGWDRWDWHRRRIVIDDRRYERINRGRPPRVSGHWVHNPQHRRGVPYSNPDVRAKYSGGHQDRNRPGSRRDHSPNPSPQAVQPQPAVPDLENIHRQPQRAQSLGRERQSRIRRGGERDPQPQPDAQPQPQPADPAPPQNRRRQDGRNWHNGYNPARGTPQPIPAAVHNELRAPLQGRPAPVVPPAPVRQIQNNPERPQMNRAWRHQNRQAAPQMQAPGPPPGQQARQPQNPDPRGNGRRGVRRERDNQPQASPQQHPQQARQPQPAEQPPAHDDNRGHGSRRGHGGPRDGDGRGNRS